MTRDPFASVELTVEYVDSAAGSRKTLTAVALALDAAKRGRKTIFAMPTLELIAEMAEFARRDPGVPVYECTSAQRPGIGPIETLICEHIESTKAQAGHLLFITHAGFERVTDWPPETSGFAICIDEALEIILSRKPFKLRNSLWVLTSFLDVAPVPTTIAERNKREKAPPEFTYLVAGSKKKTDQDRLDTCEMILQPSSNSSEAEIAMALREGKQLLAKREKWEAWLNQRGQADRAIAMSYYLVVPKPSNAADPLSWLKRREREKPQDDIYEYLDPIAKWLLQGNALFTGMSAWNKATLKSNDPKAFNDFRRGLITITGFRRPDALQAFGRVTIMSALLKHTMLYAVWATLGVKFVPSVAIPLAETTTALGSRRLRIYWLSEEGWSKRARDQAGGIDKILQLIKDAGVIKDEPVCVVVNKDDGSEKNDGIVKAIFPQGTVMPHNVRGQNRWRHFHQLVHCAALNSYTSDIRWLEGALGIDARAQRIARTGQEVYQSLMRLSLRDPTAKSDVTLVVMDRDVAEWLPQWFVPRDQVEVCEIDASDVIRRKLKPGRPAIGDRPMTAAERQRRRRERRDEGDAPA